MFDTATTRYDIVDYTPFGRDFMRLLADACRRQGLRFGTYHTILEWDNPVFDGKVPPENKATYMPYLRAQLAEIVRQYDPDVMWFDGEWESWWEQADGEALYNYTRQLKPSILVNNRVAKARKGMEGASMKDRFAGDFGTPEQEVPATGLDEDWESCITMNGTWGYSTVDKDWKSSEFLVRQLVDIASKGGNYLLNVGPRPDGTFPEESIERLAAIGDWMRTNGESIRGTTAAPFGKLAWGRATRKGATRFYLHVFEKPASGRIELPFVPAGPATLRTLDGARPVPFKPTPAGIEIDLSATAIAGPATVLVLDGAMKQ